MLTVDRDSEIRILQIYPCHVIPFPQEISHDVDLYHVEVPVLDTPVQWTKIYYRPELPILLGN